MARPRQNRVIQQPPKVKGFNPLGYYSSSITSVKIKLEEHESIRLLDYEGLSQEEAALYMKVSRPTLTRIYESARRKIAKALIEANQILIEGGNFVFKDEWYECAACKSKFNNPEKHEVSTCLLCGKKNIELIQQEG